MGQRGVTMRNLSRITIGLAGAILGVCLGVANSGWAGNVGRVSFAEDVFPILQYRCLECHKAGAPGVAFSGLNLESYEGLMKGTRYGPVVVPGNAMVSNLNVLVEGRAGIRMPHNRKRLTPCEIDILRNWVNQGAKND
ncbi:MAG: hypothetical protein HQL96_03120 [Magnetococcales bacterium]|nr:hypothetical protein [Magnetococcales bacterium]